MPAARDEDCQGQERRGRSDPDRRSEEEARCGDELQYPEACQEASKKIPNRLFHSRQAAADRQQGSGRRSQGAGLPIGETVAWQGSMSIPKREPGAEGAARGCRSCAAPLKDGQRYCLNCGQQQGAQRVEAGPVLTAIAAASLAATAAGEAPPIAVEPPTEPAGEGAARGKRSCFGRWAQLWRPPLRMKIPPRGPGSHCWSSAWSPARPSRRLRPTDRRSAEDRDRPGSGSRRDRPGS